MSPKYCAIRVVKTSWRVGRCSAEKNGSGAAGFGKYSLWIVACRVKASEGAEAGRNRGCLEGASVEVEESEEAGSEVYIVDKVATGDAKGMAYI